MLTRIVAACLAAVSALAPSAPAHAFAPTPLTALGSHSHESITKAALTEAVQAYFGVAAPNAAMAAAADQIAAANAAVDSDQITSAKHFDGENFDGGQHVVRNHYLAVLDQLRSDQGAAARASFGSALHTLQDFYAHSNWIELGHREPNPLLWRTDVPVGDVARPTDVTCNGSNLVTDKLTSGYYASLLSGAEDRRPLVPGKCRHGGLSDTGSLAYLIPPSPDAGIAKDSASSTWAPHWWLHAEAARLAQVATRQFLDDIRSQVTPDQIRTLLSQ